MVDKHIDLRPKAQMNRQFVWEMVRKRLSFLITEIMISEKQIEAHETYELSETELRTFMGAHVPVAEICDLCRHKDNCEIRARLQMANAKIHAELEQVYGNQMGIGTVFSIYHCGVFDFLDVEGLMKDLTRKTPLEKTTKKEKQKDLVFYQGA